MGLPTASNAGRTDPADPRVGIVERKHQNRARQKRLQPPAIEFRPCVFSAPYHSSMTAIDDTSTCPAATLRFLHPRPNRRRLALHEGDAGIRIQQVFHLEHGH
jgi:hypothetical protein